MGRRPQATGAIFAVIAFVSSLLFLDVDEVSASSTVSIGFDVNRDGFGFANWSGLTASDDMDVSTLRDLFGDDQVCQAGLEGCALRPSSARVLEQLNAGLSAGRCEGMIVLAARRFVVARSDPDRQPTFAEPRTEVVERITYWWGTQFSPAVQWTSAITRSMDARHLADDVFDSIARGEIMTLGLYRGSVGHSVLPIAATRTADSVSMTVYDPNFPGRTRTIVVRSVDGAWSYDGGLAPDGSIITWVGSGVGGLDYVPLAVRDIPIVVRL